MFLIVDLWVMSRHAAVSHRPTPTPDVPPDQPTGDVTVSAFLPSTTAWHSVLVTNLGHLEAYRKLSLKK